MAFWTCGHAMQWPCNEWTVLCALSQAEATGDLLVEIQVQCLAVCLSSHVFKTRPARKVDHTTLDCAMISPGQMQRGAVLRAAVLVACVGSPAAATQNQILSTRLVSEGLPASFGEAKDQAWARMEEALWDTAKPYVQASLQCCTKPHGAGVNTRASDPFVCLA